MCVVNILELCFEIYTCCLDMFQWLMQSKGMILGPQKAVIVMDYGSMDVIV